MPEQEEVKFIFDWARAGLEIHGAGGTYPQIMSMCIEFAAMKEKILKEEAGYADNDDEYEGKVQSAKSWAIQRYEMQSISRSETGEAQEKPAWMRKIMDWPDDGESNKRQDFIERLVTEVEHAYKKHGRDQWGRHEFRGILDEEVEELHDAITGDLPQSDVEKEFFQIAAVCLRYFETRDRYREPRPTQQGGIK